MAKLNMKITVITWPAIVWLRIVIAFVKVYQFFRRRDIEINMVDFKLIRLSFRRKGLTFLGIPKVKVKWG